MVRLEDSIRRNDPGNSRRLLFLACDVKQSLGGMIDSDFSTSRVREGEEPKFHVEESVACTCKSGTSNHWMDWNDRSLVNLRVITLSDDTILETISYET